MSFVNQTTLFHTITSGNITFQWLLPEIGMVELFLALLVFVTIHSLRQGKGHGLPAWPLVGMMPSLLLGLRHDMYEWLTGILVSQNCTFTFRGPWLTNLHAVVTADPANLEHILKTNFSSFPKGPYFHDVVRDLLGDGIFSTDDEDWRQQRKVANIEFHSPGFRSMMATSLVDLVHSRLLPVLDSAAVELMPIDLQDVLLRLTFDNVCIIAFNTDPGCLRPGLPEIPFARAFENATEATTVRFVTPTAVWKALRFCNVGIERRLKTSVKTIDEFAYHVIQTRKRDLSTDSDEARSDLLTVFMRLKDADGSSFSDKLLRDVCVNIILAGRDTSSVALAWFFWLLNKNPTVEERILEELKEMVKERGEENSHSYSLLVFRPLEVKRMEYLQAALSEALRLYPSVPVDFKQAIKDEVFPDGTELKKGTKILYSIYSMGRMESIWGKDCREYKPERWLNDGRFMTESAYKFTAFNGGPRLCLGKDFAYYQMKFVAASILYRYRVKVVESHPVVPKLALTMYMKYGLKVTLVKRDDSKDLKRT